MPTARVAERISLVLMRQRESNPQRGAHQSDQWARSDRPSTHIYGCGRLIRSYFPGLERQACGTAAGQHRTPVPGSNRWRLVTDSDTAIGLERPIYLMASPEAGDSHYFSAWTLVDDSAGAKTIHFITAALTGEPSAIFTGEPFLVYKSEFNEVQS